MFRTAEIEAIVRNDVQMRAAVIRKGGMALQNGSKLEQAIMAKLTGYHAQELKEVATELGFNYDDLENTYYLGVSKGEVRCYAPRMVLRQGTLKLRWGNQYRSIDELQQAVTVIPNVLVDKKYTKVSLALCTFEGYELVFRIYPKETLNTAQLMKLLQGGDWSVVLEPERPTDIRHTVNNDKTEFQFLAVGFRTYTAEGKTKDGREFSIDKMVLMSDEGDEYELKAGSSRQAVDFAYWGKEASVSEPVRVTVTYDGLGDYNGNTFPKVNINYNPVNNKSSLADLLELDDDYDGLDNDYV